MADTFPISAASDDCFGYKADAVYANVPTNVFVDRSGGGYEGDIYATRETGYYIGNGFVRFDTSALPDTATVTSATLDLYIISKGDPDSLKLVGDWYDFGGTPSVTADWKNMDVGENALEVTLASLTASAVNSIPLSNVAANISLSGYTGIRLGISKRAADAAPTGFNGIQAAAYDHATLQEPRLIVTYTTTRRTYKRLYGPAQLTASAADLYTCPASTVTRVLSTHVSNPSGSPVDVNLSIGADAEATRIWEDHPVAADKAETNFDPYELAAGEKIQGWADSAETVVLTITGYEDLV